MRHVKRLRLGKIVVACVYVCASASPRGLNADEPNQNVVETFDVARNGDILLIPVTLGGRQFRFAVDTGCTGSVIDSELESQLDPLPSRVQVNGRAGYKLYQLHDASVGNARLPLAGPAVCTNLSLIREATGYDIRGIVGMSFLKDHVVHIDFDDGKLSILRAASKQEGSAFRLTYDTQELPLLWARIADGDPISLVVDTGMLSGLECRNARIRVMAKSGKLKLMRGSRKFATFDGVASSREGILDAFFLGDFKHEEVIVKEGVCNRVGMRILSQYVLTFDFPVNRMYLKPGKRFGEAKQRGWCGINRWDRIDGKTRVNEVQENGPAAAAGLNAGDEILSIDGKSASSLTLFEMGEIVNVLGSCVRFDVEGPTGRRQLEIRVVAPPPVD